MGKERNERRRRKGEGDLFGSSCSVQTFFPPGKGPALGGLREGPKINNALREREGKRRRVGRKWVFPPLPLISFFLRLSLPRFQFLALLQCFSVPSPPTPFFVRSLAGLVLPHWETSGIEVRSRVSNVSLFPRKEEGTTAGRNCIAGRSCFHSCARLYGEQKNTNARREKSRNEKNVPTPVPVGNCSCDKGNIAQMSNLENEVLCRSCLSFQLDYVDETAESWRGTSWEQGNRARKVYLLKHLNW